MLLLWTVATLACAGPVLAEQRVVILGNDYKVPKIYADASDRPRGILVDIARLIDSRMPGYEFEYHLYPWVRAYNMARNGAGGIIGLSRTTEREQLFDFSEPVYMDSVAVVVLAGREFPFSSIGDLAGKRVGIGRGGTFGDEFERMKRRGEFTVVEDNGPVLRLRMLLRGRIDCALISPKGIGLAATLKKCPALAAAAHRFVELPVPLDEDPNHLGFAKTMRMGRFLREFNRVLRIERESGAIQRIIESHVAPGAHAPRTLTADCPPRPCPAPGSAGPPAAPPARRVPAAPRRRAASAPSPRPGRTRSAAGRACPPATPPARRR